jgi:hypothetical protein
MMRKSIVFIPETPEVFYCPQIKPTTIDQMYVKARPLDKLCEFHGKRLPRHYRSDCYNDVDETEFACMEKERITVSSGNDEESCVLQFASVLPWTIDATMNKKTLELGQHVGTIE